jgi:hypothetical protein
MSRLQLPHPAVQAAFQVGQRPGRVDICGNVAIDRHQWHILSGDRLDEEPDVSRWDGIDIPPHRPRQPITKPVELLPLT